MVWKKAVGAVVLAGAISVPVGAALAHGHQPSSHPGGPPSGVGSPSASSSFVPPSSAPPSGLPSAASSHGRGQSASHIPSLVQADQQLQRQVVATRLQTVGLMQQVRAALVADEQAGNTTAVTAAVTELTALMTTARTALQDQHLAAGSTGTTPSGSSSSSGSSASGRTAALTNIENYRTAELQTLMTLESGLKSLLGNLTTTSTSPS